MGVLRRQTHPKCDDSDARRILRIRRHSQGGRQVDRRRSRRAANVSDWHRAEDAQVTLLDPLNWKRLPVLAIAGVAVGFGGAWLVERTDWNPLVAPALA